ncbi:MAG: hypothetical protein LIO65_02635 [Odoribacter sp.]|nr:hypothetical protein [Odoribacter sp.]
MAKRMVIEGSRIKDIPTFYEEVNRVFMVNEDWKIAESLDALNDMFYGGFGEIKGREEIELVWKNMEKSKEDLGLETTGSYYEHKLHFPSTFNMSFVKEKLSELEHGTSKTYFEMILEIIAEHANIKLIGA